MRDVEGLGPLIVSMGKFSNFVVRLSREAGKVGLVKIFGVGNDQFIESRPHRFPAVLIEYPLLKRVGGEMELIVLVVTIVELRERIASIQEKLALCVTMLTSVGNESERSPGEKVFSAVEPVVSVFLKRYQIAWPQVDVDSISWSFELEPFSGQ